MATSNIYDLADTWNEGATTFTAIKMNVTDTASAAGSLLMDLQVGGTTVFSVDKIGKITYPTYIYFAPGGANVFAVPVGGPQMRKAATLGWVNSTTAYGTPDLMLARDDAGVLAQRNGANAQTARIYNTYTDASNYERLSITGSAITVESAGTGTANIDLSLVPAGTGNVKFGTHAAIGAETVTGYITIKDSGGVARKLAVVS